MTPTCQVVSMPRPEMSPEDSRITLGASEQSGYMFICPDERMHQKSSSCHPAFCARYASTIADMSFILAMPFWELSNR